MKINFLTSFSMDRLVRGKQVQYLLVHANCTRQLSLIQWFDTHIIFILYK